MTDPIKLLPCPICGRAPSVFPPKEPGMWHHIECTAATPNIWHDVGTQAKTARVAAGRWNKLVGKI